MKVLRSATQDDLWALQVFLRRANISIVDLEDKIEDFIILEEENEGICGTIGVEEYGSAGLLRSLVIGPSVKQFQLLQMFEHTQQHARKKGLEQLYLITNKNNFIQFFELLNFYPQPIHTAPQTMLASDFFQEITQQEGCTLMVCELRGQTP
ncbi:hypothetical protein FZC76_05220 [Sutcliffiella horikoshii]|uniref:N-acetyltransferase domain-containing protein n=1 Tax=Sutcliffiella horikoshii TaxID=79883 RepID=A0A5D4T1T2_9BACI|nr:hypothetical protein [Sutcliffiella horikoshii]TYS69637.1 hypothetical protein FZC76_05220 [Sutcliffiella horikoshii]